MAIYKKGENWYIDYYAHGRRKREKIGPSKKLAEQVLAKRKVEIAENRFLDIKRQKEITFENMAKEYIERYAKLNKKSWISDVDYLKNIIPFFQSKYLFEINPQMIEDYKAKRIQDGVKPSTVNHELACMKCIYSKAIEWDKATENPVKKVKMFKVNDHRIRFLEKGELKFLLDVCKEPLKSIVIFAVNTGMRLSEIINLVWDNVDFVRGLITVTNTKNNEIRYIPVNTTLSNLLEKLKQKCNPNSAYVFCDSNGKKFKRYTISHKFAKAVKAAKIRNFRFHDLRHTFASYLAMAGVDIMTIKELLGHKSLTMTLRYSHLSPNFKRSAVEVLCTRMDTIWTPKVKTNGLLNKEKFILSSVKM
ncbi:MAG: tyrosine-type recombinase/integrase [Elusimicrobiota bacterium]